MAFGSDVNIVKHKGNFKKTIWGKMAHDQVEMGIVNKMAPIN